MVFILLILLLSLHNSFVEDRLLQLRRNLLLDY